MVLGPGAGHVEQADAFVEAHLLVDGLPGLELVGGDVLAEPVAHATGGREDHLGRGGAALGHGGHAAHDGDRELQALGGVDGHDPHGVVVGLGQDRFGHPAALAGLAGDPLEVLPEPAVRGLAPPPGLVDDEAEAPPHVPGPALGEAQLEQAPVPGDAVEQLAGGPPVPFVVELTEVGDAGQDRPVGHRVGLRSQVVPVAALDDLEAEQVVVTAGEQRAAQRRDDAEVVGRVVDGAQCHEEIPHGARHVHERARLGPVGDAGGVEGVLEERQRGAGRDEHGDVAEAGRPPPIGFGPVVDCGTHAPALGDGARDGVGDLDGLVAPQHLGRALGQGRPGDDRDSGSHGRTGADRVESDVVGLRGNGQLDVAALGHEPGKGVVDPVDDRSAGTEVGGQLHQVPAFAEAVSGVEEDGDVGPAEPVDRLLRVTHHEELPGVDGHLVPRQRSGLGAGGLGRGDAHGELDLDRVRVLELVEQEPLVAVVEPLADRGAVLMVRHERPGQHQQVVEGELTGGLAAPGGVQGEGPQRGGNAPGARLGDLALHRLEGLAGGCHLRPEGGDVAAPLALGPHVADPEARQLHRPVAAELVEQVQFVVDPA